MDNVNDPKTNTEDYEELHECYLLALRLAKTMERRVVQDVLNAAGLGKVHIPGFFALEVLVEELERISANDQIKELLIERIKNDLQNPFEYCDISKGSAGSCIFCCLVCGAGHFRNWPRGQGNPSWCVDCARSGRSKEPDGRVVPVLERKIEDWKSLWDIFDERKRR